MKTWLHRRVPITRWLPALRREDIPADLIAGVTVAVLLVPQAMAYALLAGLPPVVGLYAALIPPAMYAVFGTAPQLAVGPVAMDSLLVATAVGAIATQGTGDYLALATLLAAMVGLIQLGLGLARAGFLVNFLSKPVVSGFTSAAALIIGFSQLKHLLGYPLPGDHRVHLLIWTAIERSADLHAPTLALGLGALVILIALQKLGRRLGRTLPGPLVVVAAGTLLVTLAGLDGPGGIQTVGAVPGGLPALALPVFAADKALALLPGAATIAFVAFMEAISVARFVAARTGQKVDPNQELIALGAANLGTSLTGGYPVAGGFSRTAVNVQAGARTPLSSLVTAALIGLTLIALTPLFTHLPVAVLAAIIMLAVFGLIDGATAKRLWKTSKSDFAVLALTFLATLQLGITPGIGVGVAVALLVFVIRSTRPHYAVLGRLPGSSIFRNVRHYPEARTCPGVLVLRFDAPFYYGNVSFLADRLAAEEAKWGPLTHVVLDATGITALDASGADALVELAADYGKRGIDLRFSGVRGPVRDMMGRVGLVEQLGADHFFFTVADAVASLDGGDAPGRGCEGRSPLAFARR